MNSAMGNWSSARGRPVEGAKQRYQTHPSAFPHFWIAIAPLLVGVSGGSE